MYQVWVIIKSRPPAFSHKASCITLDAAKDVAEAHAARMCGSDRPGVRAGRVPGQVDVFDSDRALPGPGLPVFRIRVDERGNMRRSRPSQRPPRQKKKDPRQEDLF